jgi:hypothetical protein
VAFQGLLYFYCDLEKAGIGDGMLTTRFVSNCTAEQVDDLKVAALYFDVIEVVEHRLYTVKFDEPIQEGAPLFGQTGTVIGATDLVSDEFRTHLSVLEKEGLLRYVDGDELVDEKIADGIRADAEQVLSASIDLLWEESDVEYDSTGTKKFMKFKFSDPEVERIHEQFVGTLRAGARVDLNFVAKYYGSLLISLLGSVATGVECVTASPMLNTFVKTYYESRRLAEARQLLQKELGTSPSLAYEAVRASIPDVSKFSLEDVLSMRHELNDELLAFRQQVLDIHEQLVDHYDPLYVAANARRFVERKIDPALDDLDRKIGAARSGVLKKLFDELRDPKAYAPLIGTFFDKIPLHIATMASLGFISVSTAWDYVRNMNEIKNNGLYYLIDLRTKAGK